MKAPRDIIMWAAIIRSARSRWINWNTVASTRRESRRRYLAAYCDEARPAAALRLKVDVRTGRIRFEKVRVSIEPTQTRDYIWDITKRRFKKVV